MADIEYKMWEVQQEIHRVDIKLEKSMLAVAEWQHETHAKIETLKAYAEGAYQELQKECADLYGTMLRHAERVQQLEERDALLTKKVGQLAQTVHYIDEYQRQHQPAPPTPTREEQLMRRIENALTPTILTRDIIAYLKEQQELRSM